MSKVTVIWFFSIVWIANVFSLYSSVGPILWLKWWVLRAYIDKLILVRVQPTSMRSLIKMLYVLYITAFGDRKTNSYSLRSSSDLRDEVFNSSDCILCQYFLKRAGQRVSKNFFGNRNLKNKFVRNSTSTTQKLPITSKTWGCEVKKDGMCWCDHFNQHFNAN